MALTGSDLLDRLGKQPRQQRVALYVLLAILLVVGFYFLLWSPKGDELAALDAEQVSLRNQLAEVEKRAANKASFEAELASLTADLKQALKELPNDREIPGLLKSISTLGRNVGLDVPKFQPEPEVVREYVAEVPVSITVTGSYHEVAMFFDRLSKMNRIVYVRNIEMSNPIDKAGKVLLTVSGRAVTFRFMSEDEISAAKDAKSKGRKGGGGGGDE